MSTHARFIVKPIQKNTMHTILRFVDGLASSKSMPTAGNNVPARNKNEPIET